MEVQVYSTVAKKPSRLDTVDSFFMSLGWLIVYLIESAPHEKRVERRALPFFPKLSYHVLGGEVQVNLSSGKPIMP